jgi:hypothetical protein
MATREPIYAALATLVFSRPGIIANFVTTGRFLRHHEQLPAGGASCPAIYLVQHPGEEHYRIGKGISVKRTLKCAFVMYFYTADNTDPGTLPATACNAGLDAIDDAINVNPEPGNVQTLGGLVEHVYTEGAVAIAEGLLAEFSIVAVPITIVIP